MSKAFVILTHEATAEKQAAIGEALKGCGWWHYTPQAWVILDPTDAHTTDTIRAKIMAAAPEVAVIVFQIDKSVKYAAYILPDWHDWLSKHL
ncbi:MAG: hypothetical protein ACKVW3_06725 [Phycisphaerales bacterium]